MSCREYIVIGQNHKALMPRILMETSDLEEACKFARDHLAKTKLNVYVFNTCTYLCELALTYEQE